MAQQNPIQYTAQATGKRAEGTVNASVEAKDDVSPALAMLEWILFRYESIPFDYASHRLSPEARNISKRKARWIKDQDPKMQLMVIGHCDRRGSDAENMYLGALRANAVKQFLISCGIDRNRLQIVSAGDSQPLEKEKGEEARAKNRRVEVMERKND
jgi:peptidoglycan-associated lipoprotein